MNIPDKKPLKGKLNLNKKTILKLDQTSMKNLFGAGTLDCATNECVSVEVGCKTAVKMCDTYTASCRIAADCG